MHFLSSKLKRFDVHTKTIDGVNDQQTVTGAIITIVTVIIVFILTISEIREYSKVDVVSRMVADTTVGVADVEIVFDIEFSKTSCNRITFTQEVTRGTMHSHEPEHITKDVIEGRSCWVHGAIVTDKVGGSFRFMIDPVDTSLNQGPGASEDVPKVPGMPAIPAYEVNDISHRINTLAFVAANGKHYEADIPEMAHPLNGQVSSVDADIKVYQYAIQVVPTYHSALNKKDSYHVNQYSVTERQIAEKQLRNGVVLNGQTYRNVMGVVFTYDFYPVMLVKEEKRESMFEFFSNLCAIVGGVITLLGLIEQCIHRSTKAVIGKKD